MVPKMLEPLKFYCIWSTGICASVDQTAHLYNDVGMLGSNMPLKQVLSGKWQHSIVTYRYKVFIFLQFINKHGHGKTCRNKFFFLVYKAMLQQWYYAYMMFSDRLTYFCADCTDDKVFQKTSVL